MNGRRILKSTARITGVIFAVLLVATLATQFFAQRQLSKNSQELSAFCGSIPPGTTRAELTSRLASKPGYRSASSSNDSVVLISYHTCHCTVRLRLNQVVGATDGMCNG